MPEPAHSKKFEPNLFFHHDAGRRSMSFRMGSGFSRVIWFMLCVALVAMAVLTGKYLWLAISCQKWPAVPGVIVSSAEREEFVHQTPRQSAGPPKVTYRADIRYTYTVNGAAYNGTQVSFGDFAGSSGSKAAADERVARYASGNSISVHYDPSNPGISVLETRLAWSSVLIPAMFAAGALICGLGCYRGWRMTMGRGPVRND
jgi:Protein of unknown function (DUF3592)